MPENETVSILVVMEGNLAGTIPKQGDRTMNPNETQCRRNCRTAHPYEPELWCSGCTIAEAVDREANWLRWRASETRREALELIEARLMREAAR